MNSILFTAQELESLHPFNYVKEKTTFLQNCAPVVSTLPSIEVAKQQYSKLSDQLRVQQFEFQKQLNPDTFQTIFDHEPPNENLQLKQEYYQKFIIAQEEEQEQKDQQLESYTHLCGIVNDKQKLQKRDREDKLLELQILKRELEQLQEQKNYSEREVCRNMTLIERLSGSLMTMYNLYFPEIMDALFDDLLFDEVFYPIIRLYI